MLDPRLIREKPDVVRESLKKRGYAFDLENLIGIDERRRRADQARGNDEK